MATCRGFRHCRTGQSARGIAPCLFSSSLTQYQNINGNFAPSNLSRDSDTRGKVITFSAVRKIHQINILWYHSPDIVAEAASTPPELRIAMNSNVPQAPAEKLHDCAGH